MENAEEVFHILEDFSKRKPKTIPQELNDYLTYVARTGDPVYQWPLVKSLFKEKLLNVITEFYETTPGIEIPPYPNVDPFNYDIMKNSLLERLDSFTSAPFTVQRICELLTYPRKQYNRVDKFMRAVEKNILVVSTREPGAQRHAELENGEPMEPIVNGSDNNSEYNVDVEMEDVSWKENSEPQASADPQPSSSDTHISVDDIEARLQAKQDPLTNTQEKTSTQYESVTPPELNLAPDEPETNQIDEPTPAPTTAAVEKTDKIETVTTLESTEQSKVDVEMKAETAAKDPLIIPEIKVDDAEMTERRLSEANITLEKPEEITPIEKKLTEENKSAEEVQQTSIDDSSSDSNTKEETEPKVSEVSTSSEESSSSSDNTDGYSNSPKNDNETHIDVQEESNEPTINLVEPEAKQSEDSKEVETEVTTVEDKVERPTQIQSDNYSISDVHSELPQPPAETPEKHQEPMAEAKESKPEAEAEVSEDGDKKEEEKKSENTEASTEKVEL